MSTDIASPKCPKTGKRSFLDEASAVAFEERNRQKYNLVRQFAYACEDCDAWHLTASPPGNNSIAQTKYEPSVSVSDRKITHFFHITSCGAFVPEIGQTVRFEVGQGKRGPAAINVELLQNASDLEALSGKGGAR